MRVGITRVDPQRSLKVRDRLSQVASLRQDFAEFEVTPRGRPGSDSVSPQRSRIPPDPDLVPGENAQSRHNREHEPDERSADPRVDVAPLAVPPRGCQAAAAEKRPTRAGQVGVSISGDLWDPDYRGQHHYASNPGSRKRRPSAVTHDDDGGDDED